MTDKNSSKSGSLTPESSGETPTAQPEKIGKEIVEYETVHTKNPITGDPMVVRVEKTAEKTDAEMVSGIKGDLQKYGLQPYESMDVRDPFTGTVKTITLDRTGTHDQKLGIALLDPKLSQEQKDSVLSMYLYEHGKQNTSMLVDLWRSKGTWSKESQVFQSRMRFDFETFVGLFVSHLERQVRTIGAVYGVSISEEKDKFETWLKLPNNKEKGYTYYDYSKHSKHKATKKLNKEAATIIQMAIHDMDEAKRLSNSVKLITQAREAQRGGGIFVSSTGTPYSMNDPAIEEIIKKDRELQKKADTQNPLVD